MIIFFTEYVLNHGPFKIIKHSVCNHKSTFICSNCFSTHFQKNKKTMCRCEMTIKY